MDVFKMICSQAQLFIWVSMAIVGLCGFGSGAVLMSNLDRFQKLDTRVRLNFNEGWTKFDLYLFRYFFFRRYRGQLDTALIRQGDCIFWLGVAASIAILAAAMFDTLKRFACD